MGKEDVVYIYKQMCVSSMLRLLNKFENEKKKQKLAICNNMDGPLGHYAKWNKSERNILWSLLYVKSKK